MPEPVYQIYADSIPVYDGWGPGGYWSSRNWTYWFEVLAQRYGQTEAVRRFLDAYHENSWGAAAYTWRIWDKPFKTFARDNGFYDGLFENLGGFLDKTLAAIVGFGDSATGLVTGTVETVSDTLQSTLKVFRILLPILAVGLFLGVGFFLYRRYLK